MPISGLFALFQNVGIIMSPDHDLGTDQVLALLLDREARHCGFRALPIMMVGFNT